MKKLAAILTAALITLVPALSVKADEAPTYPLQVRGGGHLHCSIESRHDSDRVTLIVDFGTGTGPAGAGLYPGQGSWLDRGMRPGEAPRILAHVSEHKALEIFKFLRSSDHYYTFDCHNIGNVLKASEGHFN